MKKYFFYSIVATLFLVILGGFSFANATSVYFPGTKIIQSIDSFVSGSNTKATVFLDFSEETSYNNEGQKYFLQVNENGTNKKIAETTALINADQVLATTITGLTPSVDYTLFLKPYGADDKVVNRTPPYAIGFKTYSNPLLFKSFTYNKTTPISGKQTIEVSVAYEWVPEDAYLLFSITNNANPTSNKSDITPTNTFYVGKRTIYRYSNADLANNGTYIVKATVYDKDGKILDDSQSKGPDTVNGSSDPTNFDTKVTSGSYQFLTNLPGLDVLCETKDNNGDCIKYKEGGFGDYLGVIIKLIYGLVALIAVFQIVYYGITYMLTATPFLKTTSRERVENAVMGIVIALGSYLILYTINPSLVSINVNGPKIEIQNKNQSIFSLIGEAQVDMYNKLGGVDFKRTSYYEKIKNFISSHDYSNYPDKIPQCLAQVAVQRESGGDPNVVGHDENAPSANIPARNTFISSGKKSGGSTFSVDNNLITNPTFLNDDNGSTIYSAKNPSADDLGLDWRFSHGIGLKQVTFYPSGSAEGAWDKGRAYPISTNKTAKPKDMLDPDKAIEYGVELLQVFYKSCGKDVTKTYKAYASGSCDSTNQFAVSEAAIRTRMYDQCIAQDR